MELHFSILGVTYFQYSLFSVFYGYDHLLLHPTKSIVENYPKSTILTYCSLDVLCPMNQNVHKNLSNIDIFIGLLEFLYVNFDIHFLFKI